jgi:type VII secretion-associated serine protease mycosin
LGALVLLACAALPGAALGPLLAARAAVAAPNDVCAQPGQDYTPVPWQQQVLAPERVWPFSRGSGVTIAVLSTGVDANQPQLHGRVSPGFDAAAGSGTAADDCVGSGTQVAGVIAAQALDGHGLVGLAPAVTILPVRVVSGSFVANQVSDAATLAKGIGWAVDHGAGVIDVAAVADAGSPALQAAVADALARNVIVVAAAGDLGDQAGTPPTPYPAAYDGVIGVGAVDPSGTRWNGSQAGPFVDLVAPGAQVVAPQRGHGMIAVNGTGIASGLVAAAAALVRGHSRSLSQDAVARQLIATATPVAGGPDSPIYGAGLVNPYGAVTDQLAGGRVATLPSLPRAAAGEAQAWTGSRRAALTGTGAAVVVVLVVLIVAFALPRGRRRLWRSGLAKPLPPQPEEEPGPPVMLFDETASPGR